MIEKAPGFHYKADHVRDSFADQVVSMKRQLGLDEVDVLRVKVRFSELAAELDANPNISRFFFGMAKIWSDEKERRKQHGL